MGICQSLKNEKQRGPISEVQNLYSNRTNVNPNTFRTKTVYQAGEEFYIKEDANAKIDGDTLREKVELLVSLRNVPINSSMQYRAEVYLCSNVTKRDFTLLGKTEVVMIEEYDTIFNTSFFFDYFFEREQLFKVDIYKNNTIVTSEVISVGKVMGSKNLVYEHPLTKILSTSREPSTLILTGNKKMTDNSVNSVISVSLNFFDNYNSTKKFPVYYVISRKNNMKDWKKVYKSDEFSIFPNVKTFLNLFRIVKNSLIATQKQSTQEIKLEIMNPINGEVLGIAYGDLFVLDKLHGNETEIPFSTNNSNQIIGNLYIKYEEEEIMQFVDYLKNGIDINLVVAIDYTASNGNANETRSLHYVLGNTPNNYEKALVSCGRIVSYYDRSQLFPVFGFGGIPQGMNQVNHCFPINGLQDPRISGIDAIAQIYHQSLYTVKLSGPTYFHHVIQNTLNMINTQKNSQENKYYVLLLLTDGIINDMTETCDLIVEASLYPLSIIIVGIGEADFGPMNTLDGDDIPLTNSKGEARKRDLVQFVKFNDFKDSCVQDASALAAEVLEEIPRQVDEYYRFTKSFVKKYAE